MITVEKLYQYFKQFQKISTDTRSDVNGSIFFALSGENFNGNLFAEKAIEKGAELAVVDDKKYEKDDRYLLVEDSLRLLQELALFHRNLFHIPVLGITGSNGKTTTKELVAAVLAKRFKLTYTQGNLNNHIGVPLTLLTINKKTELAVIEMGANHVGEISTLCNMAKPTIGLITNIGKAHIEGFGSFEGVIKAKSELYQYIQSTKGELIVNANDDLLMKLSKKAERFTYGSSGADIISDNISVNPSISFDWINGENRFRCRSNLYGKYNLENMLAAIAIGVKFDIPGELVNQAVENYVPSNNRSQLLNTKQNKIILDAYNANPVSMFEAVESFAEYKPSNAWLILGDMFELGPIAHEEHEKIIHLLNNKSFSNILLVGKEFYKLKDSNTFLNFASTADAKTYLRKNKITGATILIKGSRGMQLEQLLEYL